MEIDSSAAARHLDRRQHADGAEETEDDAVEQRLDAWRQMHLQPLAELTVTHGNADQQRRMLQKIEGSLKFLRTHPAPLGWDGYARAGAKSRRAAALAASTLLRTPSL